jgi:hypothetical protein
LVETTVSVCSTSGGTRNTAQRNSAKPSEARKVIRAALRGEDIQRFWRDLRAFEQNGKSKWSILSRAIMREGLCQHHDDITGQASPKARPRVSALAHRDLNTAAITNEFASPPI